MHKATLLQLIESRLRPFVLDTDIVGVVVSSLKPLHLRYNHVDFRVLFQLIPTDTDLRMGGKHTRPRRVPRGTLAGTECSLPLGG